MNRSELPEPLRGIVPPMATPLLDGSRIDTQGLERLIEHILAGGASGLFILGSTGEGSGLSHGMRHDLVQKVCVQVRRRVPVLVAITDTCFAESLELASVAARQGASAVVAAPPYYLRLSQPELLGYVRRLAAELPLPLLLYNIPSLTKINFDPETVVCAAEIPGVSGIKDSSEDLAYFKRLCNLLRGKGRFSLLTGSERLLSESLASGAHGGVCGTANISPSLLVNLYRAASSGDEQETARLQQQVDLLSAVYRVSRSDSSYLRGLKCALSCLGICNGTLAEPYEAFGPTEAAQVREVLVNAGLIK